MWGPKIGQKMGSDDFFLSTLNFAWDWIIWKETEYMREYMWEWFGVLASMRVFWGAQNV